VLPSNRYIPHRVSALIQHLAQAIAASADARAPGVRSP
jgi:hypothetical protein